ncbi:NADH:flavin oxidoreductase/NADH oxidase [Arthrobacter sp. I2-34]|uniref:NADH:flavin oxidoreductase/NADH oxidase n=2 Tax=Arthrobacter hankyongi TaxID=2904801 RepID=A0ABS9LDF2_9MICC|nr:NADH:flavin oxidoreductase/NADH oxidase [Arthrobacter hankyongi]
MSRMMAPVALPTAAGPGPVMRNRTILPPMCQYSVDACDGVPRNWQLVHLGARAAGGFGLVMAEATAVAAEGRISDRDTGLWNDAQRDAWKPIVQFIQAEGALAGIQIAHAGGKASTYAWHESEADAGLVGTIPLDQGGWQTLGPSDTDALGLVPPREMSLEQIDTSIQSWVHATRRAHEAGFDVLQIHAAHGYLIHEFLSPLTNHRSDRYGGPFENRVRYAIEVIRAVRTEWPEGKPLGIRLSGEDWNGDAGWQLADTIRFAQEAHCLGVTLFDISSAGIGRYQGPFGPGYQVPLAAAVKEALRDTNAFVTAVGMVTEAAQAEQILVTGQADGVNIGRAALCQPNWPVAAAVTLGEPDRMLPQARQYWQANWQGRPKRGANTLTQD